MKQRAWIVIFLGVAVIAATDALASPYAQKPSTERSTAKPKKGTSKARITWSYTDFPLRIELYSVKKGFEPFVSQTRASRSLEQSPADKPLNEKMTAPWGGSVAAALVVKNTTDKTLYFFAVPHEMNPHHASAGHYFECLCTSRVFKIPPQKVWTRIVRLSLNSSFQGVKEFEIKHQIIGVSESEATTTYKDRLYAPE